MNTPEYKIFYSWQSDDKNTRNIIKNQLQAACESLEKENINFKIIEDSRTENGAEHIDVGLLQSISDADLFIGDVTPVTSYTTTDGKTKLAPNGNVLFEAGYALAKLGNSRCRLVARLEKGQEINDLPFDVNHRKLLLFSTDNRESLKGLVGWLRSKVEIIEQARNDREPKCSVSVLFNNFKETIDVSPQFERIHYIKPKPETKHNTNQQDITQTILGRINPIRLVPHHANLVQPTFGKPITRKIDKTLVEIELVIENTGTEPLDNCEFIIGRENEEVTFHISPIDEQFRMPIPISPTDLWISEDGSAAGRHFNTINPKASLPIGSFFVSLPPKEEIFVLHWHFNSRNLDIEGELLINSKPLFNDNEIASTLHAGEDVIRHIILSE